MSCRPGEARRDMYFDAAAATLRRKLTHTLTGGGRMRRKQKTKNKKNKNPCIFQKARDGGKGIN